MSMKNIEKFVENGRKIIGVGRNYRDHCAELGNTIPKKPLLFLKPPSCYLKEGNGPILIPRGCTDLHHEVELAIVIGEKGTDIKEEHAYKHIAGYALALDMTARDFQQEAKSKGSPWTLAKGFDTALPISRFITSQELADPSNVKLWLKVNDKIKQDGVTSNMIFNIPYLLSYISQYFTLDPGDVILTGTPAGVSSVGDGDKITCGLGSILEMKFDVAKKS